MADILIRGMEMPKTCQICRTAKFDRIVGCEEWDRLSIAQRMYMRSETCPLVPLPEGHGRLIDADALIRDKSGEATLWCGYEYQDHSIVFEEDIKNAPTIIPAERAK